MTELKTEPQSSFILIKAPIDNRRKTFFHEKLKSKTILNKEVDVSLGKGQPYHDFIKFVDKHHHSPGHVLTKTEIMKEKFREKFRVSCDH
jgi:hypothetical protein